MLDLDYKTDASGNTTEFILLGMNKDQVKCLYGALLKQRAAMHPLIEHFKNSESNKEERAVRDHLQNQYQNIDMLIAVLKHVC